MQFEPVSAGPVLVTGGGSLVGPLPVVAAPLVVGVVGPDLAPGATPKDVATWPGPPLPGDQLSTGLELYCVAAEGEAADAVLEAAAKATVETIWKNPDGGRWSVTLRPLLPHETGCGDLPRI